MPRADSMRMEVWPSMDDELERLVVGPDDLLVVRLPSRTSREVFDLIVEAAKDPRLDGRVLFITADQMVIVRQGETAETDAQ
jgi:hypothetical protein